MHLNGKYPDNLEHDLGGIELNMYFIDSTGKKQTTFYTEFYNCQTQT